MIMKVMTRTIRTYGILYASVCGPASPPKIGCFVTASKLGIVGNSVDFMADTKLKERIVSGVCCCSDMRDMKVLNDLDQETKLAVSFKVRIFVKQPNIHCHGH